ncbi:Caspase domain-containing protein [Leptolyngbya sp. 'hensonii']|uniref:caspase family protein n=1 Tax=Leptolyngbya sp. 'hensonii' TaxID=1922337 RepID=UPI00094F6976|nr:caspase family protein [Leptolyngbya sp. 'hensonii']OLP17340.1 Caspase domain-containing protein [Leptolyngbya sp. 'hensonii']
MPLVTPPILAFQKLLNSSIVALLLGSTAPVSTIPEPGISVAGTCQEARKPLFAVFGGGGAPSYNEIALEKNVLYFQRTLKAMGYDPKNAAIFFANGNSGEATVRYIDPSSGQQKFKVPQIPNLSGASSPDNLRRLMQQTAKQMQTGDRLFFYFTGHGGHNRRDEDNNVMLLWRDQPISVRQFTRLLDQMPQDTTFVAMMAQCYSGAFANLIYEGGDATRPLAPQSRCGFFATIKTRPSVGCTPAVNEADYRDYSSSFFAGLSGRSRTGTAVASADYNRDGRVSYAEAHAFAKVDEQTTDLPISTSEVWLQKDVTEKEADKILGQPIVQILPSARPEQRFVVESLARKFSFNLRESFLGNLRKLNQSRYGSEENQAYLIRLQSELVNISVEKQLRSKGDPAKTSDFDRILKCEGGSW